MCDTNCGDSGGVRMSCPTLMGTRIGGDIMADPYQGFMGGRTVMANHIQGTRWGWDFVYDPNWGHWERKGDSG